MKECTDEELLEIFEVPKISDAIITPSNYSRGCCLFASSLLATLIRTYGKTSYTLIETVVDVIVSHSPQQQTNKLYMEAMGVLITLFSRMLRNVPLLSPYLISRTTLTTPFPRFLPTILPTSFWTFYSFVPECPSSLKLPLRDGKTSPTGPPC